MPRTKGPTHASVRTLDDLQFDPNNANRGTARGRDALEASLREYGAGRAVLIDRYGRVVAGNKTVETARRLGLNLRVVVSDGTQLIAVQRDDLDLTTDPRAKALALADNRVAELDLDWDPDVLRRLRDEGLDLTGFWTADEFDALFEAAAAQDTEAGDAVVSPRETEFARGDLFVLGNHRLLCGDATCPDDVARLLDGTRPALMITDPPYGVQYDPGWRTRVRRQTGTAVGTVLNDDRASWQDAWTLFPGHIAYVWHAALQAPTVSADLAAAGFTIRSQIIWRKQHFAMSRGDYHWQHEPAYYAVRGKGRWCGDRSQSTVWDVPSLGAFGGVRDGENAPTGHSTQKPLALFERPLLNHTRRGELVFDPFVGSGTTLIAAEKLGRRALVMDLDPQYVQATVDRWERFTGRQATRTGRTS